MVRKQLIALAAFAALAVAGTAVRAQEATPLVNDTFMSTKARAEVRAELVQALAHGFTLVGDGYQSSSMSMANTSTVTRDQVRAEILDALANGVVPVGDAYQASPAPVAKGSIMTRRAMTASNPA